MASHNPLISVVQALEPFDPVDLAATAGALQLMPDNAERYLSLPAFAHAIATLHPGAEKHRISSGRLRNILRAAPLAHGFIADAEDPFDYPFTESIAFDNGAYTVFPGNNPESATFVMRHVAKAILSEEAYSDPSFADKARSLIRAALTISNELARRAGLVHGMEPTSKFRGPIIVPGSSDLSRLKSAASFQEPELTSLLERQGLKLEALERLVLPFGSITVDSFRLADGPVISRPILHAEDKFVVANPESLLSAARHQVVCLALELGVQDELARRYNAAVWETAVETLRYMSIRPLSLASDCSTVSPCFQDALLSFDTDKLVYVALVTDALTDYNPEEVSGYWEATGLGRRIDARLLATQHYILSSPEPPNELLILFLSQGFGRSVMVGSSGGDRAINSPLVGLTVDDLETIAQLEGPDPLTLWKFGRAAQRIRQELMIGPTSMLNEFFYYRKRDYGYYLTDDQTPTFMVFAEGGAGKLRRELIHKRNWHAVVSHSGDGAVEVTNLHDTRAAPVYGPRDILKGKLEMLVEGLPLPVWIIQSPKVGADNSLYVFYAQFAELIAYWLWQFTPSLSAPISAVTFKHSRLLIQLYLYPDEAWDKRQSSGLSAIKDVLSVHSDQNTGAITLEIRAGVIEHLYSADNRGERDFMRLVLRGINELLPTQNRNALSDEAITTILDLHAPLGIKKKMLLIAPDSELDLDPRGLPRARKVHKSDDNELLDELGKHLQGKEGLKVGPIPDHERTKLLQKVVEYYYSELQKLVASLQPEGLLEWLITYHEANVNATAHHKQSLPTRLACFSSVPEIFEVIEREFPEDTNAALASRFVIEYVVARPPSGLRPMSLDLYDRLQALAKQLFNFGFESDLIYFNLADIKMSLLPSGRLGTDRDLFDKAREEFLAVFTSGRIARSTRSFELHWKESRTTIEAPDASPEPDAFARIDKAAEAEFGHSITELGRLMFYAAKLGQEIDPAVARLPLDELYDVLRDGLKWTREKVVSAVDFLSLGPRPDFLIPPAPHAKWSVLPWRFNRSYSYVRRPFLRRANGKITEVLWGPRHLYVAWINLMNLCVSGRIIESRSREMLELMSEINNERGEAFNNKVAETLLANTKLIVKSKVSRIGRLPISGTSGTLGDIDVLVADRRRRRLIPIECKDLAVARTAHEMANEITNLFLGHGRKKSYIEKHNNRVLWLRAHIQEVLDWLGISDLKRWKVEPLVVVNQELFSPFLHSSPMRVISYQQFLEEQADWG